MALTNHDMSLTNEDMVRHIDHFAIQASIPTFLYHYDGVGPKRLGKQCHSVNVALKLSTLLSNGHNRGNRCMPLKHASENCSHKLLNHGPFTTFSFPG